MRHRDVRELIEEADGLLSGEGISSVEQAELDDGTLVYLVNGVAQLVRGGGTLFPTLKCGCLSELPSIVVDMGAVPYVCNGADLMAPGVVEVRGDFEGGALIVIRDVRHEKALAIGRALLSSDAIRAAEKGKVAKNLHYVGDHLWRAYG